MEKTNKWNPSKIKNKVFYTISKSERNGNEKIERLFKKI